MTASLPGAQITATDLNVAMVDVGARNVPTATWRQADAMQLPFDDGSFDLVACQFGVMFFPDRPAAYGEVARVLRPGGHFVFNSWGPLAGHQAETVVLAALAECFPDDPPTFLARVPHGYHDQDLVRADLAVSGFEDVQVENVELMCTGKTAEDLARGYCRGTPLRPEIEARGDVDATVPTVAAALRDRFGPGTVTGRMSALVASGRIAG
jgi:SAM-dependent methyltransferase